MKQLKKSTPALTGLKPHTHIFYLDEEMGQGAASTDDGHTHLIQWQPEIPEFPEQPEQYDEMGNLIAEAVPYQPPQPGGWIVMPSEDGHSHEITEIVLKEKKKRSKEDETCSEIRSLYKTACAIEHDSFKSAEESEGFYSGQEQWDKGARDDLLSKNRACVSVNFIEKYIDELIGYQAQNSSDFAATPTEEGDQRVADLINVLFKQVQAGCFYQREKMKVALDCAVTGRGNFSLHADFSEDLRGKLIIERFPWRDVKYGPHEKEDLSDAEYLIKSKMFSMAKLQQLYPDKASKIEKDYEYYLENPKDLHGWSDDEYDHPDKTAPIIMGEEQIVNIAKKEYRLIECWRRVWVISPVIADPDSDFYFNAYNWDEKDVESAKTIPGISVIKRTIQRMRVTRIAGNVVLSDEYPANLPTDDFHMVPVYAKKRDNRYWGKVEAGKDVQRIINRRESQTIDIANKMSAYGWFYDATTFPDNEKEKFKRTSSSPGFMVEVTDVNQPPHMVEGVKFPAELVNLQVNAQESLRALMNITPSEPGANTSAAAILQQQKTKLTGNEYLFENMRFAEQKVGKLLLRMIQRYYSPERIVRIVRNADSKKPVELGGQPLSEFSDEDIIKLLQTADLGSYDIEITESQQSPTAKIATFMLLSDLASKGIQIPMQTLVKSMDIPDAQKTAIIEEIQMQEQAQGQAASETAKGEITKTLVGQGIIPPEVRQEYGLDQIPPQPLPEGTTEGLPQQPEAQPAPQPQQSPVVINMGGGRKRKIGRVVRDKMGNSQIEIEESPIEEEAVQ